VNPFEVRGNNTSGVRNDVRQNNDAAISQDLIRVSRNRTIGALRYEFATQPPCFGRSDQPPKRGRNEYFARRRLKFVFRQGVCAGAVCQRASLSEM
jgi:hypothetical protein